MIATPGLACPFDRLQVDLKGSDAEVLKQLEERTKLNRDALFRRKKELQRVVTDYEEDVRRLEQVKAQSDKMSKQQEHLQHAKGQVEEELVARQGQLDELADRMLKQVTKHRKKLADSGADAGSMANGSLEEKAVKAEVYKDVIQVRGIPSVRNSLNWFCDFIRTCCIPWANWRWSSRRCPRRCPSVCKRPISACRTSHLPKEQLAGLSLRPKGQAGSEKRVVYDAF